VEGLDGVWEVERAGGALPPMFGVRKVIAGNRGETKLGSLPGIPFDVRGHELRYRGPFAGFVDKLEPENGGFRGRATFLGRPIGTFRMRRASAS
jgi:hypothetical protein